MNGKIPQDSPESQPRNLNDLSIDALLADLQALENEISRKSGDELILKGLIRFSTLWVKLANEAKKTTDANIRQQVVLTRLTWALLVVTIFLIFLPFLQPYIQSVFLRR